MSVKVPQQIQRDLRHAARLEWWTLGWMTSVIVVMWLVMGSSQAMKTALVEDVLSLIPAISFLITQRLERRSSSARFPFGFARGHSVAALVAAVALLFLGGFLLFEAALALVSREHFTIAPVTWFGVDLWLGWPMIAALVYSAVPPVILGHLKKPIAERLQDEVLDSDAMMQKADWMTALAGIAGVVGVGFGLWWADAAAAGVISFSIVRDGVKSLRVAVAELMDGTPRALGSPDLAEDARTIAGALQRRWPESSVRLRTAGRYMHAEVVGRADPNGFYLDTFRASSDRFWRLIQVAFVPETADEPPAKEKPNA